MAFNIYDIDDPLSTIADILVIRVEEGKNNKLPVDQAGHAIVDPRAYDRAKELALSGEVAYCRIRHVLIGKLMLVSGNPARATRQALAEAEQDKAGWVSLPKGSRVQRAINTFKETVPKHVYVVKLY